MTFVYLAVMILVVIGIYKLYVAKTPENERQHLFKKNDSDK